MDRRHFMKHVAGYSLMALPGMEFIRTIKANAQELRRNNKSVIIMWMAGGPATIDIWDLKPGRPTGGEFRPIQTDASGVMISEHMKETAKVMKNLAIIRSLGTSEGDHMRGTQLMHTSYTPNPAIAFPSLGSVVSAEAPKLAGYRESSLPSYIAIGTQGGAPGFLGMTYAPFTMQSADQKPANLEPDLAGAAGVELEDRVQRRRRLWNTIEGDFMSSRVPHMSAAERAKFADGTKNHNDVYQRAFQLVASKDGKVFDIRNESPNTVAAYGGAQNGFGRSALMARRLLEAGASAVEIQLGGWDNHANIFNTLSTGQLPRLDSAMSALVKDLTDRGMWQNTVLVWMGDFGRTPRINPGGGRDHWPNCWSVVVGGGAIKGGQVYGSTDQDGMSIKDNPVKIGDVFATIYRGLGIDPSTQVRDAIGRPFAIAGGNGRPIENLF